MGLSFDGSMIHMDVGCLTATRLTFLGKPFSAINFVKSFQTGHSTFQELFDTRFMAFLEVQMVDVIGSYC